MFTAAKKRARHLRCVFNVTQTLVKCTKGVWGPFLTHLYRPLNATQLKLNKQLILMLQVCLLNISILSKCEQVVGLWQWHGMLLQVEGCAHGSSECSWGPDMAMVAASEIVLRPMVVKGEAWDAAKTIHVGVCQDSPHINSTAFA